MLNNHNDLFFLVCLFLQPIFLEILNRKPELRAEQMCGTIFEQFCTTDPVVEWAIDIPDNKNTTGAKIKKVGCLISS